MKKKIICAVLFFYLIFSSQAQAQEKLDVKAEKNLEVKNVKKIEYIPKVIKTGDRCFARIKTGEEFSTLSDAVLSSVFIEDDSSFHAIDIKIDKAENEILLRFIPLDPAVTKLPPIVLGNYLYNSIPLSVESVAGKDAVFKAPDGLFLLPWTRLYFAGAVAAVIVFGFAVYFIIISPVLRYKIRDALIFGKQERKIKKLFSKLAAMAKKCCSTALSDKWASDYINQFKKYLQAVTGENITSLTSAEIIEILIDIPAKSLLFIDEVRFGRSNFDFQKNNNFTYAVEEIYQFAVSVEKKRIENNKKERSPGEEIFLITKKGVAHGI